MPEFLRVTDDVKPRREYTIAAISYVEGVHKILDGKAALAADGSVLPPKYTPGALGASAGDYTALHVADLEDEIDARNEGRPEDQQISKAGKKADLVAALEADDAQAGETPAQAPESLSS